MLRPTLIVGLGTSGLTVVSEIQKLVYETFGVNRLPIFRYVYIETDSSKSHEQTPAGSDIIPIHIAVQSLQQAYRVLSNNPELAMDWISRDLPQQLAYNAQGAGGVRPAGRLLLWGDGNFRKVYDALSGAYNEIANPNTRNQLDPVITQRAGGVDPREPVVYVVGTLVGGTCSGTFIDIGYMLRQITGMNESGPLYGVFIAPGSGLNLSAGYGNAFGAIKELDFFRTPGNFYQEVWPNGIRTGLEGLPPYAIVYLISSEYGNPRYGNMRLDGCLRGTALKLFCDLIGLSSLRGAVLADGMNEGFGFFATFGISAVLYPKYSLMEALGCLQGLGLCDRWLMGRQYRASTGQEVVIGQKEILDDSNQFLSDHLQRSFSMLNTKGTTAGGLDADIGEDIDRILRKEADKPAQFIIGRFTAGKVGSYYSAVDDNLSAVRDHLIVAIRDFVYQKAKETENFEYLETLLQQLSQAMQDTVRYWDLCGVPSSANEWNDFVGKYVQNNIFKHQYAWLGQKRDVIEDRIQRLLVLMKMFCMRSVLGLLQTSILRGSLATNNQQVILPTLEQLKKARKSMQEAREELQKRESAVADEVADVSVPIHRVWHSGSFEADRNNLTTAYAGRYGVPSMSDVSGEPAWDLFGRVSSRELFALVKVGYEGRFREFLPPVNVVDQAIQRVALTREYAERALSGLLRLNLQPWEAAPGVPRFVLGSDAAPLNSLVARLRENGLQDLQPGEGGGGHVRRLPLLDHAVVFYEEKARINPNTMLAVHDVLEQHFNTPGQDSSGVKVTDTNIWKQQRLAYSIERRAYASRCLGLIEWIRDFVLIWERDISGDWKVTGVRWPDFPVKIDGAVMFVYKDAGGLTRDDLPLNPDPRYVRDLSRVHFIALQDAVRKQVRSLGLAELTSLFEREIRPSIAKRHPDEDVKKRTDWYFGSAGGQNGLIQKLLSDDPESLR